MIDVIKPATEAEYFFKSDFTGEIIDVTEEGLFEANFKLKPSEKNLAQLSFSLHLTHAECIEVLNVIKHKLSKAFAEDFNTKIDNIKSQGEKLIVSYGAEEKEAAQLTFDFLEKIKIDL